MKIKEWTICQYEGSKKFQLAGRLIDEHTTRGDYLTDKQIVTSRIVGLDLDEGTVTTRSGSVYDLVGLPKPETIKELVDAGKFEYIVSCPEINKLFHEHSKQWDLENYD